MEAVKADKRMRKSLDEVNFLGNIQDAPIMSSQNVSSSDIENSVVTWVA